MNPPTPLGRKPGPSPVPEGRPMNPPTFPPPPIPDADLARFYEEDARGYSSRLRIEDYMESTPQATQRKVTLESFDLVAAARPEVQCFNELLIHYPIAGQKQPGRVIPDNFVVLHPEPLGRVGSFALELQPARPFLVMEYVSKENLRKDYEDNFVRYQQVLRVPYYLIFYPDNEEITLFRLVAERYEAVHPNDAGRFAIPELELEAGLLDGWMRFWFRGELLPLPAELARQVASERVARLVAEQRAAAAERERDAERVARAAAEERATAGDAEIARLRELLARAGGARP